MPRKHLIRTKEFPYHVTARCNNKDPFQGSFEDTWLIITAEICEIIKKYNCKIHAFVLMPNHFHLLITTPKDDLGIIMQSFMISITKKLNLNSGRTGRVFGSRYHWSLIDNEQYYDCALKYVYRNPVKANLANDVQSYPFSSLKFVIESNFQFFSIEPPEGHHQNIPNDDIDRFLTWLNQPFQSEQESAVKDALRKTVFSPPKRGAMHKRVILEGFT